MDKFLEANSIWDKEFILPEMNEADDGATDNNDDDDDETKCMERMKADVLLMIL